MNERAVMALMRILDDYEDVPHVDRPRQEDAETACFRCTLEEVLTQVWDHPWTLASETIERFALRMEEYKATAVTDVQRRIFSVAAESAWELSELAKELET